MKSHYLLITALISVSSGLSADETATNKELFLESPRVIHMMEGENRGDQFGWVARKVGDVDADGVIDFVTTAPTFGQAAGKAYVYSTKSGKLLFAKAGKPGQRLGNGASGAGDVNGDGTPDVIVGAPHQQGGAGAAYVYSGTDGEQLLALTQNQPGDQFGYKVCEVGDIDRDGGGDVAVTAMSAVVNGKKTGKCFIYSGSDGKLLFSTSGGGGCSVVISIATIIIAISALFLSA